MATATKSTSKTTLSLVCPYCGGSEEAITLNLLDLNEVTCTGCDTTYSAEQAALKAREMAEKWAALVRGIDSLAEIVDEAGK